MSESTPLRSRRSCLAVPGSNPRFLEKAKGLDNVVYMNLTGADARDVVIHVHDGALDVTEGGTPPVDPSLTLSNLCLAETDVGGALTLLHRGDHRCPPLLARYSIPVSTVYE